MTDYTKMTTDELEQALGDIPQISKHGNTKKEPEDFIADCKRDIRRLQDDIWHAEAEVRTLRHRGEHAAIAQAINEELEARLASEKYNLKFEFQSLTAYSSPPKLTLSPKQRSPTCPAGYQIKSTQKTNPTTHGRTP